MAVSRRGVGRATEGSIAATNAAIGCVMPSDPRLSTWFDQYARRHLGRIALDLDLISLVQPQGGTILDVGCVPPILLTALSRCGAYVVTGIDVAPERFRAAIEANGLAAVKVDIEREELPFDDGTFDLIVMNEVLEHLRIDLTFTLAELRRVLKPQGKLMMSTPNLRSLSGCWNFTVKGEAASCSRGIYGQYAKLRELGHMGHVREYTSREVIGLVTDAGFQPAELVYRGEYRFVAGRILVSAFPALRPFFSLLAMKRA